MAYVHLCVEFLHMMFEEPFKHIYEYFFPVEGENHWGDILRYDKTEKID